MPEEALYAVAAPRLGAMPVDDGVERGERAGRLRWVGALLLLGRCGAGQSGADEGRAVQNNAGSAHASAQQGLAVTPRAAAGEAQQGRELGAPGASAKCFPSPLRPITHLSGRGASVLLWSRK